MKAGEWLTLAVVVAVGVAVWYGRKRGKAAHATAIAGARAEGYASGQSDARAAAVASNVVHVDTGAGDRRRVAIGSADEIDLDDPGTAALLRAVLRELGPVRPRVGELDASRVGGVLYGVRHEQTASVRDDQPVSAGRAGNGELPVARGEPVSWGAE